MRYMLCLPVIPFCQVFGPEFGMAIISLMLAACLTGVAAPDLITWYY